MVYILKITDENEKMTINVYSSKEKAMDQIIHNIHEHYYWPKDKNPETFNGVKVAPNFDEVKEMFQKEVKEMKIEIAKNNEWVDIENTHYIIFPREIN